MERTIHEWVFLVHLLSAENVSILHHPIVFDSRMEAKSDRLHADPPNMERFVVVFLVEGGHGLGGRATVFTVGRRRGGYVLQVDLCHDLKK